MLKFLTATITAVALIGLLAGSAAIAGPTNDLPPAAIVHQLVADGHEVRGIKCKPGVCTVAIRDNFGIVNQYAVNARTGQVIKNGILSRFAHVPGVGEINGIDAMLAAAQVGHFNLISIEYRGGTYDIRAKDDAGEIGRFKVNAVSKAVVEIEN